MPKPNKPASAKSRMLILRIAGSKLRKFPFEQPEETPSSPSSSAVDSNIPPSTNDAIADDAASNAPSNSANANGAADSDTTPMKRKGVPGPKPGMKRSTSSSQLLVVDGISRPRGKPGPKKKMRIDGVNGTPIPVSAPKLNPKANQGAINANLRALDRSGAPCRKWVRAGFQIKSFTGVMWSSGGAWASHKRAETSTQSDAGTKSAESSVQSVAGKEGDRRGEGSSEKSVSGEGDTPMMGGIEGMSSPAVVAI